MNNDLRNIYFISSDGEPRLLARNVPLEKAVIIMHEFMSYHNFRSYYTRSWDDECGRWFDVGSWTEFFLWGDPKEGECQSKK